jgi:small subunit ribosomal protein S4e
MPRTWKIKRKGITFITRPNPGPHSFQLGLSLDSFMKYYLPIAKTTREVKFILKNKDVLVDNVARIERRFIVGLLDSISMKKSDEHYRIVLNKFGQLDVVSIPSAEISKKAVKIVGKKKLKKGKTQLNMFNGVNVLVDKDEYKIGDSVLMSLPDKKIEEHLPFKKGASVYLIGGKHIGDVGVIEDIKEDHIIYKSVDKEKYETLRRFCFIIGKAKPSITVRKE